MSNKRKTHYFLIRGFKRLSPVLVSMFLSLLFLLATFTFTPSDAKAYSCTGHCYAVVLWSGTTGGTYTGITVQSLTCNNCNGFINNETWLIDQANSSCSYNSCWAEVGVKNESGYGFIYFWADNRPGGGYNNHYLTSGPYPSADVGNIVNFQVQHTTTNTFEVRIWRTTTNYTDYSTSNSMQVDAIETGAELLGTSGASAPHADYTYNQWRDPSAYNWHYQTGNGLDTINYPPYGGWNNAPNGGDWYTSCC